MICDCFQPFADFVSASISSPWGGISEEGFGVRFKGSDRDRFQPLADFVSASNSSPWGVFLMASDGARLCQIMSDSVRLVLDCVRLCQIGVKW